MKIIYIGRFPPPYGGVTIKNKMLYDNLSRYLDIEKLDLGSIKKLNFKEMLKLSVSIFNPSNIFIIGAAGTSRKLFSSFLYHFNRKALNQSLLIIMGGIASRVIANEPKYLKYVAEFKQVYVETEGMKSDLNIKGLSNVSVFPNCRERPKKILNNKNQYNNKLKCLFFSLISKDKGVDVVLETADLLNQGETNYSIDFYGHIENKYKPEFEKKVKLTKNVSYCGVFKADQEELYSKLQQYDLLLFPTRWKAEGVPGVLVEAKIAGIPSIVSDINYNSEIIENSKDGLVLTNNSSVELAKAIERLYLDRDYLIEMKKRAKLSSEKYLIENYIEAIVKTIKG